MLYEIDTRNVATCWLMCLLDWCWYSFLNQFNLHPVSNEVIQFQQTNCYIYTSFNSCLSEKNELAFQMQDIGHFKDLLYHQGVTLHLLPVNLLYRLCPLPKPFTLYLWFGHYTSRNNRVGSECKHDMHCIVIYHMVLFWKENNTWAKLNVRNVYLHVNVFFVSIAKWKTCTHFPFMMSAV